MAGDTGTSIFRAIADFASVISGSKKVKDSFKDTEDQTEKTSKEGEKFGARFSAGLGKASAAMSKTGGTLTRSVTLPVVATGALAVRSFAEFEKSIVSAGGKAGATGEQIQQMNDLALKMGAETKFSAGEAAIAMDNLAAAGFNATDTMGTLPAVMLAAQASGEDLGRTADVVAQQMNAFNIPVEEAGHVADVMAQAANTSALDMVGLGEAMAHAGQLGQVANQDLEDVVAAIGQLTNVGVPAAQAGVALRQGMTALAAPTKKARGLMEDLGLSVRDSKGQMLPLPDILDRLKASLDPNSAAMKALAKELGVGGKEAQDFAMKTLFGVEGGKAFGLMLADTKPLVIDAAKETDKMRMVTEGLTETMGAKAAKAFVAARTENGKFTASGKDAIRAMGAMNRAADGVSKTFADKLGKTSAANIDALGGSLETLAIRGIQAVAKPLNSVIKDVTEFVNKLAEIGKENPKLAQLAIYLLLGAAAAGPLLIVLSKVVQGAMLFGKGILIAGKALIFLGRAALIAGRFMLANPILLIITAIAVAAFLIIKNWSKIKPFLLKLWAAVVNATKAAWNWIKGVINAVWTWIKDHWEILLIGLLGPLGAFITLVAKNWDKIKAFAIAAWNAIKRVALAVWGPISAAIKKFVDFLKSWFGDGSAFVGQQSDKIRTFLSDIWEMIGPPLKAAWEGAKAVFSGAVSFIKGWANFVKTAYSVAWKVVVGWFKFAAKMVSFYINAIKTVVMAVWRVIGPVITTGVKAWWGVVKAVFSAGWNFIKGVLTIFWTFVKTWVANVANVLKAILVGAWNFVKNHAVNVWNLIKGVISGALDFILGFVKFWIAVFTGNWGSAWEALKQMVGGAMNVIKSIITFVLNTIKNVWTTIWNILGAVLTAAWNIIKAAVTGAIQFVWNAIVSWLNLVKSFWGAVWRGIVAVAKAVWNAIKTAISTGARFIVTVVKTYLNIVKSFWTNVWNGMKAVASAVWNAIKSIVKTNVTAIKTAAIAAFNALKTGAKAVWDGIKTGITTAIKAIVKAATTLKSKVTGALKGAGSWLLSVGENIVRGLIKGIKNLAGAAGDAAVGVVKDAMAKAKKFLKIDSPSKEARDELGKPMGQGVAVGLEGTEGLVADTFADIIRNSFPRDFGQAAAGTGMRAMGATLAPVPSFAPTTTHTTGRDVLTSKQTVGPTFNIEVNNPVAERASDSIVRSLERTAVMGVFGGRED